MRNLWLTTIMLGSGSLLFGQLDSGSLTVTATRSISLQPDQAAIGISVFSGLDGSLEETLGSIADTGLTEANFLDVNVVNRPVGPGLRWDFNLTVPLAQLSDTLSSLQGLTYTVRGTQVSAERRASEPCPQPDLVADATAQARKMALAAGVALGSILSVAEGGSAGNAVQGVFAAFRFGDFSGGLASFPPLPPILPVVCSLTVRFSISR